MLVTDYQTNLRWELKRLLEIFISGGSLTATVDRLTEQEALALNILQEEGFCTLDTVTVDEALSADVVTIENNDDAKARDELVTERTKDFKAEGKTDDELKKVLLFDNMDGGDKHGRFRFVPDKLEEAGTLIAAIIRSVRPQAK